jgi:[acyl-carrier-protein] S-malonyltransferase
MDDLAFVFPGQGSQSVGMLSSFGSLPAVGSILEEASEALGQDLARLISEGPAEDLNQTINTQPAMLAAGVALYRAWSEAGGRRPAVVAGHSLGEYAALVAAGALEFRDALPLVRFRAQIMQSAVPEGSGAIAAILGLDDDVLRAVCSEAARGEVLETANFNAPSQVVIAGVRSAVERGMELAKARGAKRVVALPMSVPSHCSLMREASEHLRERLDTVGVREPAIDLINNVDVASPRAPSAIRDALVRQMYRPVRWVEVVREIERRGATRIIECGPGGVLTGLNRRIVSTAQTLSLRDGDALLELARG